MKNKMRMESAEGLIGLLPEGDVVRMCFRQIYGACRNLRKIGIEVAPCETIVIDGKEYHRKEWMPNPEFPEE